jgi:hypothetical protein
MPLQNGDRNGNEIQTTDVPGHGGQGKIRIKLHPETAITN